MYLQGTLLNTFLIGKLKHNHFITLEGMSKHSLFLFYKLVFSLQNSWQNILICISAGFTLYGFSTRWQMMTPFAFSLLSVQFSLYRIVDRMFEFVSLQNSWQNVLTCVSAGFRLYWFLLTDRWWHLLLLACLWFSVQFSLYRIVDRIF